MPTIDTLASDRARKRRTVAEHMQLAHGLAGMADDILSDLQATTHELTLCSALSGAAQAHAALASAMMLEQQARQWELQAHPERTVEAGEPIGAGQAVAVGADGSARPADAEPLTFRAGIDGVAPPAEPVKPAPAKTAKMAPGKAAAARAGSSRRS